MKVILYILIQECVSEFLNIFNYSNSYAKLYVLFMIGDILNDSLWPVYLDLMLKFQEYVKILFAAVEMHPCTFREQHLENIFSIYLYCVQRYPGLYLSTNKTKLLFSKLNNISLSYLFTSYPIMTISTMEASSKFCLIENNKPLS